MKKTILAMLLAASSAAATEVVPKDVQAFISNAETCEHFAGEIDSGQTKQRQKEIERGLVRHCRLAQHQLKRLQSKYKNDPKMRTVIEQYANDSVASFR